MRRLYLTYSITATSSRKYISGKSEIVSRISKNIDFQLSWSHYLFLMKIDNIEERKFYELEAIENNWSLRELRRQFNTSLYERLALSRDKKGVKDLSQKGQMLQSLKIL